MSASRADVLIVGAGIVGAACAWACAKRGLSVAVVEAGEIGGGATAEGMGHFCYMDDSEAQFQLTRNSLAVWHELGDQLPSAAEYDVCGTLWVAADDEEMEEVHRKYRFYSDRGIAVEVLDGGQVAKAEPNLRKGLAGGLLICRDGISYPPVVTQWLLDQAGAVIHRHRVVRLDDRGAQLDNGTVLDAAVLVNAAGTRAPQLTPGIPVKPRKGHLVITDRYPGFLFHEIVELGYLKNAHSSTADSVAFNIQPRPTGQILIGSSRQFGDEDRAIDRPMLSRMLRRAAEYMPSIPDLHALRCWTGFRPATPDNLPLIGPMPGYDKVWLATGHEGLGITTSFGTAALLAALIAGEATPFDAAPYHPGRDTSAHHA